MTIFLRLIDVRGPQKEKRLCNAAQAGEELVFDIEPHLFSKIPGSPFAYWVSDRIRRVFTTEEPLEDEHRTVKQGLATANDFRFVRCWWEVGERKLGTTWFGLAKGGAFAAYYADIFLLLNWGTNGRELKAWAGSLYNGSHWSRILKNVEFYFHPGLTWPRRTTSGLGIRCMPTGCIFADKGPAAFVDGNSPAELLALCTIMNSASFEYLVAVQLGAADAAARSYEVGLIQQTPIPVLTAADLNTMAFNARRAWSLKRLLDTTNETSHAFQLPAALRVRLGLFEPVSIEAELAEIQKAMDALVFRAYSLEGDDRAAIETWASKIPDTTNAVAVEPASEDGIDDPDEANSADTNVALHSWAVGVVFGRFDVRLATGERQAQSEPEPFDPLPARSPGMIPEADEAQFPPRPLLVDDPGHALDLTAQVGNVLERVGFPPENPETLRRWLARDFFPLHIKMYSKSRRKAPLYWQLATPSAGYSVWLYIHAFTRDTLFKVQNDYVAPKLALEERQLESFRNEIGDSPTAAQRRELEARESFVEELRAFLDEVRRVAPLWNPDLDDGVIINFSPLWRLVPHHKPWQKELKATWDSLCEGEYDWAHLAMYLWPERVVPKCATDRSLAIAHGLEDVFWLGDEDGKWKPRPIPARPVAEIVAERTSPAVNAALKSLLEAPSVPGGGGRGRPRGRRGATA